MELLDLPLHVLKLIIEATILESIENLALYVLGLVQCKLDVESITTI